MRNLLDEFIPTDHEQWLKLVEKELKTQLEPYILTESLLANPFIGNNPKESLANLKKKQTGWIISQNIEGYILSKLNLNILTALESGASGISLEISNDDFDFETVFKNVLLPYIVVKFCFINSEIDFASFFKKLQNFTKNTPSKFIFSGLEESNYALAKKLGRIEIINPENGNLIQNLTKTLRTAEKLSFNDDLDVCINIPSNENFYLNIAQFKSLKIIWSKVNTAYKKPEKEIICYAKIEQKYKDVNTQTIAATQESITSIIGGADIVEIVTIPYPKDKYSESFGPRITRNIQNILWNESFLFRVDDPSNGSYFMDDLCRKMIKEIWTEFVKDK